MNKLFLSVISFLFILFLSLNVYAYTDYSLTDIVLPNTVRALEDVNLTFILTSNTSANIDLNVTVYAPDGSQIYNHLFSNVPSQAPYNTLLSGIDQNLLYSTQPYLIRGEITTADDNPTNNYFSKYFTVTRSSDKIPVSDVPLFSGIIIALLFVFVFSIRNKKNKK